MNQFSNTIDPQNDFNRTVQRKMDASLPSNITNEVAKPTNTETSNTISTEMTVSNVKKTNMESQILKKEDIENNELTIPNDSILPSQFSRDYKLRPDRLTEIMLLQRMENTESEGMKDRYIDILEKLISARSEETDSKSITRTQEWLERTTYNYFKNRTKLARNINNKMEKDNWCNHVRLVLGNRDVKGRDAIRLISYSLDEELSDWLVDTTKAGIDLDDKDLEYFINLVCDTVKYQYSIKFLVKELYAKTPLSWKDKKACLNLLITVPAERIKTAIFVYKMEPKYQKMYYQEGEKTFIETFEWYRGHNFGCTKLTGIEEDQNNSETFADSSKKKRKIPPNCEHRNHTKEGCWVLHPELKKQKL